MVVGARLLEPLEVLLELLGGEERRPIHAREHLVARIAAPVRPGDRLELERLDPLRARRVRAAAQIGERTVGVERDGLERVGGVGIPDQVLDQLDLVVLALGLEALERLGDGHVLAHERLVGGDVLAHLRLDPLEVGIGDRDPLGELEVVVEAVLDRRADRDLDPRVELEHRRREHVRGVVADQPERVLAAAVGEDLQPRACAVLAAGTGGAAAPEGTRQIARLTVDDDRERRLGQPRADRRGGVGAGRAVGQRQLLAIGEHIVHRGFDANSVSRKRRGTGLGLPPGALERAPGPRYSYRSGRLAQLGERRVDNAEVAGSSPASSIVQPLTPSSGRPSLSVCHSSSS